MCQNCLNNKQPGTKLKLMPFYNVATLITTSSIFMEFCDESPIERLFLSSSWVAMVHYSGVLSKLQRTAIHLTQLLSKLRDYSIAWDKYCYEEESPKAQIIQR